MPDKEDVCLLDLDPLVYRCSLCNKSFTKESTQKRHGYYCRIKLTQPSIPRRKSCFRCIRAKVRCTWLERTGSTSCVRCNERGFECQQDGLVQRRVAPEHDNLNIRSTQVLPGAQGSEQMGDSCSTKERPFDLLGVQQTAASTGTYDLASSSSVQLQITDWGFGANQPENLNLPDQFRDSYDFSSNSTELNYIPDLFVASAASMVSVTLPGTLCPFDSVPFSSRITTGPGQIPASLIKRMLRSYPFMLLRKEIFPPFVSRLLYSWAETGKGHPQQALINCVSLVHLFKAQADTKKRFIWTVITIEQERILSEHINFDRWELLAAFQALVIYCLLRLSNHHTEDLDFDIPLLTTINLVARALAASITGNHNPTFHDNPRLAWGDWIFNESMRRTIVVFRILNMVVNISAAIPCRPISGFVIVPLASNVILWEAGEIDQWQTEFKLCYEERTIYGLSEAGQLIRLQQDVGGTQSSSANWEEWGATAGDLGYLVTVAGIFLESKAINFL